MCTDTVHRRFGLRGDAALDGKFYPPAGFVSGIWLNPREDLDESERAGAVVATIVRGQVGDSLRVNAGRDGRIFGIDSASRRVGHNHLLID